MMSLSEALDQAASFLDRSDIGWDPATMRLAHEFVQVEGSRAVVPYNSIKMLDTGDWHAQLLGNVPVVVDLITGECRFMTWEESTDRLSPEAG